MGTVHQEQEDLPYRSSLVENILNPDLHHVRILAPRLLSSECRQCPENILSGATLFTGPKSPIANAGYARSQGKNDAILKARTTLVRCSLLHYNTSALTRLRTRCSICCSTTTRPLSSRRRHATSRGLRCVRLRTSLSLTSTHFRGRTQ